MKSKIKYTNKPLKMAVTNDFLPSPENLVLNEDNVRVTITLSKSSVKFFKNYAKKAHTHYQKMIRKVLDSYTAHYKSA